MLGSAGFFDKRSGPTDTDCVHAAISNGAARVTKHRTSLRFAAKSVAKVPPPECPTKFNRTLGKSSNTLSITSFAN